MPAPEGELGELLARVSQRDRAAFEALYRATSGKLCGVVTRILRRRELVDEVLQDAYVRIWERASDFDRSRGSALAWMATIARNRALDEVRRKREASLEEAPEAEEVPDTDMLASERVELSDEYRRLEGCLEALEAGRKEMVRLAYLEGWSRRQLASRFGHPEATINTWLFRSLKQLKDCLGT
jgi:RNA polymerase sigma-70 factor (ECF subfamily)